MVLVPKELIALGLLALTEHSRRVSASSLSILMSFRTMYQSTALHELRAIF